MNWWQDPAEVARLIEWLDDGPDGPVDHETMLAILRDVGCGEWDAEYSQMCREQAA